MTVGIAVSGVLAWGFSWALSIPFATDANPFSTIVAAALFAFGALALFGTMAFLAVVGAV